MKRSSAIAILLVLAIHFAGFYVYFFLRMVEIHRESKEALRLLPVEALVEIVVPAREVKSDWLDEMEFEWQGKMYDIASIQTTGNTVHFYCYHDEAEDNLLAFLDHVARQSNNDKRSVPSSLTDFFSLQFLPSIPTESRCIQMTLIGATPYVRVCIPFVALPDAPPPRLRA